MTEAKIGPTHGVQSSPNEKPINRPPKKPVWFCDDGANPAKRLNQISIWVWIRGMSKLAPKIANIKMEMKRSEFAGIPLTRTIVDKNKVKKVKLVTNPATTPSGFCFPVPSEDERMIGSKGRMHGESTVTIPAKNAKKMSSSTISPYILLL